MRFIHFKPLFIILACFTALSLHAQQTSTDTTWKIKARQNGVAVVPPYPKDLTVAQDGSGDYKTIQEAINAVRDLSQEQVTIHIEPGMYREKLVIPSWKTKIFSVGRKQCQYRDHQQRLFRQRLSGR